MSVGKFRYALVLLAFTRELLMASCESETTKEIEKSKEYLRHQQSHRQRSFPIDRSKMEKSSHEEDPTSSARNNVVLVETRLPLDGKKRVVAELSSEVGREEKEPETSIEKPTTQIRHGRSRSHFVRQIKLEDLESSRVRTKRIRPSSNVTETSEGDVEKDEVVEEEEEEDGEGRDRESAYLARKYESGDGRESNLDFGETTKKDRRTYDTADTWTEPTRQLNELIRKVFRQHADVVHTEHHERDSSLSKLRKVSGVSQGKHRHEDGPPPDSVENATVAYGRVVHSSTIDEDSWKRDTSENAFDGVPLEDYETLYDPKTDGNGSISRIDGYEDYEEGVNVDDDGGGGGERFPTRRAPEKEPVQVDIVTRFLRIIENQHLLGENCTAGTDLNLGEGVVDRYAQERFRLEANLAVNRANMLTRLWKYAPDVMLSSEYLLHASVLSMVEFDEDIFAAGNCYDKLQYKDRWLYCPFAHRLQDQEGVLVKDLAIEYKYLSNSSEWFYIARKNAERVIASNNQFSRGECRPGIVVADNGSYYF
ncbi:hypothetical protein KPH14_009391 [Odynerus spinipes]|uniref:Uncharacterized protein n=1 Tax=Odynerus spinipes TaxID=1348599 RepID=A0AAD9RPB4_9HYME|nr:hypothetical protein KPH14_009391 [Odynerus spinipes]